MSNSIYSIRICNIPAQAEVTLYHVTRGNYSPQAIDPEEYHGCRDLEYNVLDRRGRPAAWLEAKMDATKGERDRVDQYLFRTIQEDRA